MFRNMIPTKPQTITIIAQLHRKASHNWRTEWSFSYSKFLRPKQTLALSTIGWPGNRALLKQIKFASRK